MAAAGGGPQPAYPPPPLLAWWGPCVPPILRPVQMAEEPEEGLEPWLWQQHKEATQKLGRPNPLLRT